MPRAPYKTKERQALLAFFREHGPASAAELEDALGRAARDRLGRTRARHPGKFFRIVSYRRQVNVQGREIPIYAAQEGPDRARPRSQTGTAQTEERRAAQKRAYYHRHKASVAARRSTKPAEQNPWMQLAHKDVRPIMSRIGKSLKEARP